MEVVIKVKQKFNIKYILADFGVRYYEDAEVNGVEENEDEPKIPCIKDDRWVIKVDVDNGRITNWEKGTTAKVYYKVCDDGEYTIVDSEDKIIKCIHSYVPSIFAIDDDGFGDYVYMTINEEGFIENWSCTSDDINDMIKSDFYNEGDED